MFGDLPREMKNSPRMEEGRLWVIICRIGKIISASVGGKSDEVSSFGVSTENPSGICGCGAVKGL
jgi:hypothetical protein